MELSRAGVDINIRSMEGLRGLAILLVIVAHYTSQFSPWITGYETLWKRARFEETLGSLGVDLFFILSGYLIYGSLLVRDQGYVSFLKRRIRRLYPAFTVVFLLYVALSYLFPSESRIPKTSAVDAIGFLAANFFMMPPLLPMKNLFVVAWSLSYEMAFYIMVPVVIWIFDLRSRALAVRLCILFGISVAYAAVSYGVSVAHIRMLMFLSGMILFEIVRHNLTSKALMQFAPWCWLGVAMVFAIDIHSKYGIFYRTVALYFVLLGAVLACFSGRKTVLSCLFGWTPLRWLGNMSFSVYLLHVLMLKVCLIVLMKIIPPTGFQLGAFIGLLPFVCVLSIVLCFPLFAFVEKPFSLSSKATRSRVSEAT